MENRELVEMAAKAAGIKGIWHRKGFVAYSGWSKGIFSPLTDDGDALRLAVNLNIHILLWVYACEAQYGECESTGLIHASDCGGDVCAVTRRAITLAAAQIGKEMA